MRFVDWAGSVRWVVLDNLRERVLKPDVYDPQLNPLYRDLLAHYQTVAQHVLGGPGGTTWPSDTMARRWAVTGLLDAATRLRRIRGHADLKRLLAALDARCGAADLGTTSSTQLVGSAA